MDKETISRSLSSLIQGDKDAYAVLFREFYASLLSYSIQLTKNRDVSEDIVQGFFCWLWENREALTSEKSIVAYFYVSIRNRSLNYLRDQHLISLYEYDQECEDDIISDMMLEEVYRELYAAIKTLPERCREILYLKLEGKNNVEIARSLSITEDTVRSQFRRGKELLQKKLFRFFSILILYYWSKSNFLSKK